jgi:hypothetical protein
MSKIPFIAIAVFLVALVAANLSGVGNAAAVAINYQTATVTRDGNLESSIPESVSTGLGGLANLVVAVAVTLFAWLFRGLHAIANWINDSIVTRKPPDPDDASADSETWEKCESLLSDAIFRGDRNLTIILCERMHGKPYLRAKSNEVENA